MNPLVKLAGKGFGSLTHRQTMKLRRPASQLACSMCSTKTIDCRRFLTSNVTLSSFEESNRNQVTDIMKSYGIENTTRLEQIFKSPAARTSPDVWKSLLDDMLDLGLQPDSVVQMAMKHPELLHYHPKQLQVAWQTWFECFHVNATVKELVTSYPELLSLNRNEIIQKFNHLRTVIGSNKFTGILLMKCPQIMFQNLSDLQMVSDYISQDMIVQNAVEYYQSVALGCSLEEIKTRHFFLLRCGKYKTPNLKHKIPTTNPSLMDMYDTTEEEFATKVAGLTLEEFTVFQEMFERELQEAEDSSLESDYESDEDQ